MKKNNVVVPKRIRTKSKLDDHVHTEEQDEHVAVTVIPDARVIRLFGEVNREMSFHVWNFLNQMEADDPDEEIDIIINSGGGASHEMFAIVDAMKMCKCPISVTGVGLVASAATLILAAGDKGKRFLAPNATVMVHEITWGTFASLTDIQLVVEEASRLETQYLTLMSEFTGKPYKQLKEICSGGRDAWMDAKTAIKTIGLADKIAKELR